MIGDINIVCICEMSSVGIHYFSVSHFARHRSVAITLSRMRYSSSSST